MLPRVSQHTQLRVAPLNIPSSYDRECSQVEGKEEDVKKIIVSVMRATKYQSSDAPRTNRTNEIEG